MGELRMNATDLRTKTEQSNKARYAACPTWQAKRVDAQHRVALRASTSLEASDDWLDDLEGEGA